MNQTVVELIRRGPAQPALPDDAAEKSVLRIDAETGLPAIRSPRPVREEDVRAIEDE
jgi:hypothetical protein